MVKSKKKIVHKTGYIVSIFGDSYWHRTYEGAEKRAMKARNYANGFIQIEDIESGKLVYGGAR